MEILYTPEAREDLIRIRDTVEERWDNPELTLKVLRGIIGMIRNLSVFPYMGIELRKSLDMPTEYRSLFYKQNYIFYRIEQDTVWIIRILNEKEDFMRILFGVSDTDDLEQDE